MANYYAFLGIVENNRKKYAIDDTELASRQEFVDKITQKIHDIEIPVKHKHAHHKHKERVSLFLQIL